MSPSPPEREILSLLGFIAGVFDGHDDVRARMFADDVDVTRFQVDRDLCLGIDGLYRVLHQIGAMPAAHAGDLEFLAHWSGSFSNWMTTSPEFEPSHHGNVQ